MIKQTVEIDIKILRIMILMAEDTFFSAEESKYFSPWLLNFALEYRDSNDSNDQMAVWSALRTGASMLRPHEIDRLLPFLEEGHIIDTSKVALKMIGRCCEVHFPTEIDSYDEVAQQVYQINKKLIKSIITESEPAAKAQLAFYALITMGSSNAELIAREMCKQEKWFIKMSLRKLLFLRVTLENYFKNTLTLESHLKGKSFKLLEGIIHILENTTK